MLTKYVVSQMGCAWLCYTSTQFSVNTKICQFVWVTCNSFILMEVNTLQPNSDERSVAIAVRTHRTLELVDDKFYMITCGKAGFQNTRFTFNILPFCTEIASVASLNHSGCSEWCSGFQNTRFTFNILPFYTEIASIAPLNHSGCSHSGGSHLIFNHFTQKGA